MAVNFFVSGVDASELISKSALQVSVNLSFTVTVVSVVEISEIISSGFSCALVFDEIRTISPITRV
jgi:hypothetical protein